MLDEIKPIFIFIGEVILLCPLILLLTLPISYFVEKVVNPILGKELPVGSSLAILFMLIFVPALFEHREDHTVVLQVFLAFLVLIGIEKVLG